MSFLLFIDEMMINSPLKEDKESIHTSNNVLVKALKRYRNKADRVPMPEKNIYFILESAMEEKYKYDTSKQLIV